jgi:hypothetical protein
MKPGFVSCFGLVLTAGLSLLLSGCGENSNADVPTAEVRGAPITRLAKEVDTATNAPLPAQASLSPQPGAPSAKAETSSKDPEFVPAGFEILSGYNIEISDELLGPVTNNVAEVSAKTEALIPPNVKAFDKKRVALKGFMLPLKVEGGLVTEMLVMKDQSMCCFGTVPKIHEWVSIKMTEKGVKPLMDQPVTLLGKLHVGEMRENGYLTGIYRMDGEKLGAQEGD